jgi:hypothetical protein
MNEQVKITHRELCIATAKKFNKILALYEYKSYASAEEPDVLIFDYNHTKLFEIKISMADFKKDQKKDARQKIVQHWSIDYMNRWVDERKDKRISRQWFRIKRENPELVYVQPSHLGSKRYYVCPWGLIKVEDLPEGWGLYYYKDGDLRYKNGKFRLIKESAKFRSNLRKENDLAIHAFRRYASGDSTGILVNTYGDKNDNKI